MLTTASSHALSYQTQVAGTTSQHAQTAVAAGVGVGVGNTRLHRADLLSRVTIP